MDRERTLVTVLALLLILPSVPLLPPAGAGAAPPLLWSYSTGGPVLSVPVAGDLDGDGRDEVVVSSTDGKLHALDSAGRVKWRFGAGGGFTASPLLYDLDPSPGLEVLCPSSDGKVYLLRSDGTLLWSFQTGSPIEGSPALGDVSTQPGPEIAVATTSGMVFLLNSTGGKVWNTSAGASVRLGPLLVDLDRDGLSEVVVATSSTTLLVFSPTGALVWSLDFGETLSTAPTAADLDRDGYPEILVGTVQGLLHAIARDGQVLWTFAAAGGIGGGATTTTNGAGGSVEVLVASWDNFLYILDSDGKLLRTCNGAGRLLSPAVPVDLSIGAVVYFTGEEGLLYTFRRDGTLRWTFPAGGLITASPSVADMDRDGLPEILFGAGDGKVYAVRDSALSAGPLWPAPLHDAARTGSATASPSGHLPGAVVRQFAVTGGAAGTPLVAELLPGGGLELAVPDAAGNLSALSLRAGTLWRVSAGGRPSSPMSADTDMDGAQEVVFSSESGVVWVVSSNGTPERGATVGAAGLLSAADLNGDGGADIVMWNPSSSRLMALKGNDLTTLWSIRAAAPGNPPPVMADLEGDGLTEVIIVENDNLTVLDGQNGAVKWSRPAGAGPPPVVADMDRTGNAEIVYANATGGLRVYSSAGSENWRQTTGYPVRHTPSIGDFDGDGEMEIALPADGTGLIGYSARTGARLWTVPLQTTAPPFTADITGDSAPEIIVPTASGLAVVGRGKILAVWPGAQAVSQPAAGDLDGDGAVEFAVPSANGVTVLATGPAPAARASWPMERHDAARSGNAAASVPAGFLLPNLALSAINMTGSTTGSAFVVNEGDTITISVEIVNSGARTSPATTVSLKVDAAEAGSLALPALAPLQRTAATLLWEATGGEHTIEATVEPDRIIAETDESDNRAALRVTVNRRPLADAGIDLETALNFPVPFDGTNSSDPEGAALSFLWDFGDGATSADAAPVHAYNSSGRYSVNLTVTDSYGATGVDTINVSVNAPPRIVSLSPAAMNGTYGEGETLSFSVAAEDPEGDPVSVEWWAGGTLALSGRYPAAASYRLWLNYSSAGALSVEVRLSDRFSTAMRLWNLTVMDGTSPAAGWWPDGEVIIGAGESATLGVNLSNAFPAGSQTLRWWVDGVPYTQASGVTLALRSAAPGAHRIEVEVTAQGRSDSHAWTVRAAAGNRLPSVTALPAARDLVVDTGRSVDFALFASDPDGDMLNTVWFLNGVPIAGAGGSTFSLPPRGTSGTVTVSAAVSDGKDSANATWRILVNEAPRPSFSIRPPRVEIRQAVSFDGTPTADDGPVNFAWDFGDGATASGAVTSHSYGRSGVFRVRLTVTDEHNRSSESTGWVVVKPPASGGTLPGTGGAGFIAAAAAAVAVVQLGRMRGWSSTRKR